MAHITHKKVMSLWSSGNEVQLHAFLVSTWLKVKATISFHNANPMKQYNPVQNFIEKNCTKKSNWTVCEQKYIYILNIWELYDNFIFSGLKQIMNVGWDMIYTQQKIHSGFILE